MAALASTLLSLGLLLCLGLLLTPASAAQDSDSCMFFSSVFPTIGRGIRAHPAIYESSTNYTISVPVNNNINSVVLRALDMNNNSVGLWLHPDRSCNSSVLYHTRDSQDGLFMARWRSPSSVNVTTVEIQAFALNPYNEATFSYLKLKNQAMIISTLPSTVSKSRPTTTRIPTTTRVLTTPRILTTPQVLTATSTLTVTRSLGNRIFLGPITDTIPILLIFLTSKLLF
ncbi:placenta-expressed transcript 1 protein [Saccopteryx bilineata]|uniref:placenta-expressed transcript 1 protein n=1 Tax=Saccopteryx bilineata TaxID=59482 RepID=UPI00338FDCAF